MAQLKINKLDNICNHTVEKNTDKCKKIRKRFISILSSCFSADAPWLQKHLATCPRCQKRLASIGRVNLALSFIKSQSHNLDLLMRANTQAINVLQHSIREVPKAQKLKIANPEPKLIQKVVWCLQPSMNLAACILVLFLLKFGIFSTMDKFQTQGRKTYKQYFVSNIGQEMADDVFPGDLT